MICPRAGCGGDLRVKRTYSAGVFGKTQEAVCLKCQGVATSVVIVFIHEGRAGESAYSRAQRMRREGEEAAKQKVGPLA